MKKNRLKQLKKESINPDDPTVQQGLMNIYSNKDGSIPDISHLEVKRKAFWKIALGGLAFIILLVIGITWLSYNLLNSGENISGQTIELKFNGKTDISSGDEITYTLKYENKEKINLGDVEIIFRYPEGFEYISAQPEPSNEFNTSWKIGNLGKQEKGKIEIKGKLIGEVGSLKTINATASFKPENFSSIFKEAESFSSQITNSILEIDIEGPKQILPEKEITYKIKYRNNSEQELEKIKILAEYPVNFVFKESSPEPFHREEDARILNNQWIIENLEKNQEGEIEILGGYLIDEEIDQADFKVQIGFLDEETDKFSLQQEKVITTEIINTGLNLDLIINGSSQSQPINFGQTLTYSLIYKNSGQKDLDDVTFSIVIDSDILNWETLEDKNSGIVNGNKIIWGKDQISEFDLIRPLDEGSIDFSITIEESGDINLEGVNLQVGSIASATMDKIDELEMKDFLLESNLIESNINTDIQLKVEGRYFDDDNIPVGTGPLPPVVGEKTSFRVYWAIANSLHSVSDVIVRASLPDGVDWADKYLVGDGQISYSPVDKEVTWNINKISPNNTFEDINVWFDVSVIPTKQQERKLLILTDQAQLIGMDEITESEVTKTGKAVTSNLEDDPIGGGRGLVIDISE